MILNNIAEKIKRGVGLGNRGQVEVIEFDENGEAYSAPVVGRSISLFRKLFLSLVIILTATLSFGIGRLSVVGNREPVKIEYNPSILESPSEKSAVQLPVAGKTGASTASIINAVKLTNPNSEVVVSKNGSRYHYLHCSGAKQIKEENKIVFAGPQEAEAAGYTLAANCKPR